MFSEGLGVRTAYRRRRETEEMEPSDSPRLEHVEVYNELKKTLRKDRRMLERDEARILKKPGKEATSTEKKAVGKSSLGAAKKAGGLGAAKGPKPVPDKRDPHYALTNAILTESSSGSEEDKKNKAKKATKKKKKQGTKKSETESGSSFDEGAGEVLGSFDIGIRKKAGGSGDHSSRRTPKASLTDDQPKKSDKPCPDWRNKLSPKTIRNICDPDHSHSDSSTGSSGSSGSLEELYREMIKEVARGSTPSVNRRVIPDKMKEKDTTGGENFKRVMEEARTHQEKLREVLGPNPLRGKGDVPIARRMQEGMTLARAMGREGVAAASMTPARKVPQVPPVRDVPRAGTTAARKIALPKLSELGSRLQAQTKTPSPEAKSGVGAKPAPGASVRAKVGGRLSTPMGGPRKSEPTPPKQPERRASNSQGGVSLRDLRKQSDLP